MKTGMLIFFLIFFQITSWSQVKPEPYYTCIMHPEIHESKQGNCPKCGMKLVEKKIKSAQKPTAPKKNNKEQADKKKDTNKLPVPPNQKIDSHNHEVVKDSLIFKKASQISERINLTPGKTVRYDLYVKDSIVNYTGKKKRAIAINGQIPAPALVFTEGDTAEIYLHNLLDEETSLHWHGVILPNRFDGVPYLTTERIGPGETHLYKFRIVQNGTYWYHSHSGLQEQMGMYGALIFKNRLVPVYNEEKPFADLDMPVDAEQDAIINNGIVVKDVGDTTNDTNDNLHNSNAPAKINIQHFAKIYTVVLSEWTDANPSQIQRRLRAANDWPAIKKGSTQSYSEAIAKGYFKTKFINEWKRMQAMDVSDVYYNKFLLNGLPVVNLPKLNAGDKVKLNVVNAGASTYFWLNYGGGKITVIGNDGNDMQPVMVDRLIIAPAETYDVVITIPENMSYEFRATAEDRTGFSSLWLGSGMKMQAPDLPPLKYFEGMKMMNQMMKMNGDMKSMGMEMSNQTMDMNIVMYPEITGYNGKEKQNLKTGATKRNDPQQNQHQMHDMEGMNLPDSKDIITLNYDMLRSPVKTTLPDGPTRTLNFNLTGNMNRYVWTIDNKTVAEADRILIKQGEILRLILTNNSMMRHPMHLHGHDFRVINSQGEYAPLKNVIDIMPMETDTIEFAANQSGDWFFHCHILYHMMAGMGRVFTYANSPMIPELLDSATAARKFEKDNTMYHLMASADLLFNGTEGEAMYSGARFSLQQMWHVGWGNHNSVESETFLGRYLGKSQWWFPYVGFDYHYKKVNRHSASGDFKNMFGQINNNNNRKTVVLGVQYTLPWLVVADARIDGNGKLRAQFSREDIPVTPRMRFNFMGNTDKEYGVGFRYILSKWFALSTQYDSDMGLGLGINLTY